MAGLTDEQKFDLEIVSRLIGPLTEKDIQSGTARNKKVDTAFKVLATMKTNLISKKIPY